MRSTKYLVDANMMALSFLAMTLVRRYMRALSLCSLLTMRKLIFMVSGRVYSESSLAKTYSFKPTEANMESSSGIVAENIRDYLVGGR